MFVVLGTRASGAPLTAVPGTSVEDARFESIAQRAHPDGLGLQLRRGQAGGDAQAGNRRHVLGAGAPVPLVLAAGQDRQHPGAALDPQRAGALRAVELVGRQREQIDAERPHVDRNLADRLHGVGVHQRAALVGDGGDLGDRLNGADLVVRVHHRDERGVVGHRLADPVGRDDAPLIDRDQASSASRGGRGP